MKRTFFLLALLLIFRADTRAQNAVILNAMKDELARSVEQLKLDAEAAPYFLSYLVKDTYSVRITGDSGALTANSENRTRTLKTDLRVGSYALDNSNFLTLSLPSLTEMLTANIPMPLDDDYEVLRRQIWRATDKAYKTALETLAKKKGSLQNTIRTEMLPDFTKGEATSSLAPEASFAIQRVRWSQMVDQISKLFLGQPGIQKSRVDLRIQVVNSYYVNSEGAASVEPSATTRLAVTASAQADDGMPLKNVLVYTAARPDGLPDKSRLDTDITTMITDLLAARTAPLADNYSGPVLFEAQAAGELFSQGFGNFLLGKKAPVSDNPQFNAMFALLENPFLGKVNVKVAANFLSLKAIPTQRDFNRKALLGSYTIDDEGVRCRDTDLIENGILKNLLTTRTPVKGFAQSNGHFRGGSAAPSVIQLISTRKLTSQELKQELIKAVKEEGLPFGYLVKGLTPALEALDPEDATIEGLLMPEQGQPEPTQFRLTKPYAVFRIYPDGKEELVRGVEFSSLSINAFKNVIATSDQEIVYDYPVNAPTLPSGMSGLLSLMGMSGAFGQDHYATVITPSLLIGGIDARRVSGNFRKPPIVSYPLK
jgi:hypothetical protein